MSARMGGWDGVVEVDGQFGIMVVVGLALALAQIVIQERMRHNEFWRSPVKRAEQPTAQTED
jgi:hypothetical protein